MDEIRERVEGEGSTPALIARASGGDQAAFQELKSIGDYTSRFSSTVLQVKLQQRAGGDANLLARDAVVKDMAAVAADPRPGGFVRGRRRARR